MREPGCSRDGQLNLVNLSAYYCQKSEQLVAWKVHDTQGKLVVNAPATEREVGQIFMRLKECNENNGAEPLVWKPEDKELSIIWTPLWLKVLPTRAFSS